MTSRKIISKNPFTGKLIREFEYNSNAQVLKIIENSKIGFQQQLNLELNHKKEKLQRLSSLIFENSQKYAELITTEMGKPIEQAKAEVLKAGKHCQFYADNADKFLKLNLVKTEAKKSYVMYQPLGTIYVITPFNFPFWLVFKTGIPSLLMGNTLIVRNSDSTPLVGLALEELMMKAGFDSFEYQNILSSHDQLELILSHPDVKGISFTGSTKAGSHIAQMAGKYLKKSVMELGGSDPFLVLPDADPEFAAQIAINSRLANAGQVCFSAKRLLISEKIYDEFVKFLIQKLKEIKVDDPYNIETRLGPLAREDLVQNLKIQIEKAQIEGAKMIYDGNLDWENPYPDANFYLPQVLEVDNISNILFDDEIFGPTFSLLKYSKIEDALEIANNSRFGLGGTIIGRDKEKTESLAKNINSGQIFVNTAVKSDSRLPSGGINQSGWGRECGKFGVHEFANIKTVWIEDHK